MQNLKPLKPKMSRQEWNRKYKKKIKMLWIFTILSFIALICLLYFLFFIIDFEKMNPHFDLFLLSILMMIVLLFFTFFPPFLVIPEMKTTAKRGPYYYLFNSGDLDPVEEKNCPLSVIWHLENPIIFFVVQQGNILYVVKYFCIPAECIVYSPAEIISRKLGLVKGKFWELGDVFTHNLDSIR